MNIAVIGAGWWGKNIINTCEVIQEIETVFYYDSNTEVQEKFKANIKSSYLSTVDDIFNNKEINAICIATPPSTHFELTQKALIANKHVFIEKPPAFTTEEVEMLGKMATSKGLVYMLDALFLFMEPIRKIKEMIDFGFFQEILSVEMYRIGDELRRPGSGIQRITSSMFNNDTDVVEDLFFHDAGILLNFFKDLSLESIKKQYSYHAICCDSAEISFSTSSFPVNLSLSWVKTGRRRGISIYDRNFILEYDGFKQENQIIIHDLWKNSSEEYSFIPSPPLQSMLEYFLDTINRKNTNAIDYNFMKKIIKFWEEIKHAK